MAKHLTLEERDRIAHLNSRGFAQAAIAKALGRSPSVISREMRRNSDEEGMYYSGAAQRRAAQRRAERPLDRKMDRPEIRSAVQRGLHHDWSPDQIAGAFEKTGRRINQCGFVQQRSTAGLRKMSIVNCGKATCDVAVNDLRDGRKRFVRNIKELTAARK